MLKRSKKIQIGFTGTLVLFLSACGGQAGSTGNMNAPVSNTPGSTISTLDATVLPKGAGSATDSASSSSTGLGDPNYSESFNLLGNSTQTGSDGKYTSQSLYTDTVLKVSLRAEKAGWNSYYGNAAFYSSCIGVKVSLFSNGTQIGASKQAIINTLTSDGTGECDKVNKLTGNPTMDFSNDTYLKGGRSTPLQVVVSDAFSNTCGIGLGYGLQCLFDGVSLKSTGCPAYYKESSCWKSLYQNFKISMQALYYVNTIK